MINKIFVYGTLMSGMSNHNLIAPYVKNIEPGSVSGLLYHLSEGYPAMIEGSQVVRGELMEMSDIQRALNNADQLEEYRPGDKDNLYERISIEAVDSRGLRHPAWAYIWNQAEELETNGILIPDGDWRKYLKSEASGEPGYLYFAYGSCMSIQARGDDKGTLASIKELGAACLKGYGFRLNKISSNDGNPVAKANIVPDEDSEVWGKLYSINDLAREYLDRREGAPGHYRRSYVALEYQGRQYNSVLTYIANPHRTVDDILPVETGYANEILKGARDLPGQYVRDILHTEIFGRQWLDEGKRLYTPDFKPEDGGAKGK